jgi:hypothetical protein
MMNRENIGEPVRACARAPLRLAGTRSSEMIMNYIPDGIEECGASAGLFGRKVSVYRDGKWLDDVESI